MNRPTNSYLVKIVLVILLLGCLLDFPYGYYQLVRFIAFAGFIYLSFQENQQSRNNEQILYVVLALLFQPFIKIALGRTLWSMIDVLVSIGLLITILRKPKNLHRVET